MLPVSSFFDELEKISARAGVKLIKKMVGAGNLAGGSRLATTPGVLKPSAAGSQLKLLGKGSEGSAALVAHPQHGVAVRKLYDPKGISGQEIIGRKAQIGQQVQSPHVAKYYGSAQAPGGAQMQFSEYVHSGKGPSFASGSQAERQAISHTKRQTQKALHQAGYGAQDVRKANMVWDQAAGQYKTVDYIPSRKGEFVRGGTTTPENRVITTERGHGLWSKGYDPVSSITARPGQLERSQLGRPQATVPAARPNVSSPAATAATAPSGVAVRQQAATAPAIGSKMKMHQPAFAPTMPAA